MGEEYLRGEMSTTEPVRGEEEHTRGGGARQREQNTSERAEYVRSGEKNVRGKGEKHVRRGEEHLRALQRERGAHQRGRSTSGGEEHARGGGARQGGERSTSQHVRGGGGRQREGEEHARARGSSNGRHRAASTAGRVGSSYKTLTFQESQTSENVYIRKTRRHEIENMKTILPIQNVVFITGPHGMYSDKCNIYIEPYKSHNNPNS